MDKEHQNTETFNSYIPWNINLLDKNPTAEQESNLGILAQYETRVINFI